MDDKNTRENSRHHNQPAVRKRVHWKYSRIGNNYETFEQLKDAFTRARLESSNLIVGIDFTKSNEWMGINSFNRRSLHRLGASQNPYEQAISIIGKTLSDLDEDNLIPCFGFGDVSTHDQRVFSFYPDSQSCQGFEDVLRRYREIVPHLTPAGPTSFAPIIEMAMTIVEESGGQYHVLLILADGQITRSVDSEHGQLSLQECNTIDAIVKASNYPLSIIMIGVGDHPWDMMEDFDDRIDIPSRAFDNFQFVNFTDLMSNNIDPTEKEREFVRNALMKIPLQYQATVELKLLSARAGNSPGTVPLHPPWRGNVANPSVRQGAYDNKVCLVCRTRPKAMAFSCGHQACHECGVYSISCHICGKLIERKIVLC